MVLLHGGYLTAHTWDVVCLTLRDEYRCYALDQRGHGESEWPAAVDYGTAAHVADVTAFIAALGLERPILVGQSMGGMNALAYAARAERELTALIVVDTGRSVEWEQGAAEVAGFVMGDTEFASLDAASEAAKPFNPRRDRALLRRS